MLKFFVCLLFVCVTAAGKEHAFPLSGPMPSCTREVDIAISSHGEQHGKLSFLVAKMWYTLPDVALKKGSHVYRFPLNSFREEKPYGFPWSPMHISKFRVETPAESVIQSVTGFPSAPRGFVEKWPTLPELKTEEKTFDGVVYREGLSATSAGKFANTQTANLLTERISDGLFQTKIPMVTGLRNSNFQFYPVGSKGGLLKSSRTEFGPVDWIGAEWTYHFAEGRFLRMTGSSAAPGFLLESNGPVAILPSGTEVLKFRSGAVDEAEADFRAAIGNESVLKKADYVLTSETLSKNSEGSIDFSQNGWCMLAFRLPKETYFGDVCLGVLLTADHGKLEYGPKGLILPSGTIGISTAFWGMLPERPSLENVRRHAEFLSGLLRNYPVKCREWFHTGATRIDLRNEWSYRKWGMPERRGPDLSPIPPIIGWFARKDSRIVLPKEKFAEVHTLTGPCVYVSGANANWKLPRFPVRHAAFPLQEKNRAVWEQMSDDILKVKDPAVTDRPYSYSNVWSVLFSHRVRPAQRMVWTAAVLGFTQLTEPARERLLAVGKECIEKGIQANYWTLRRELHTGKEYLINGWADVSSNPVYFGDGNSMCSAMFIAQYLYAKYSGDWSFARKNHSKLLDLLRYEEVLNDWGVPTTFSREKARFSGIDMDTVSYLGLCSLEKTMEFLGDKPSEDRIAYLRMKTVWSWLARFNFVRYFDPEKKYPNLQFHGFGENYPNMFGRIPPASKLTERHHDHSATIYCWLGQHPEMFQTLNSAFPEKVLFDYQFDFIGKWNAGWERQEYWISTPADYIAARAWLKSVPEDTLKRDYEKWMHHMRTFSKWGPPRWKTNLPPGVAPAPPSWDAGMLAVLQNRDAGIYLMDWGTARPRTFLYDRERKTLTLKLSSPVPFFITMRAPRPKAVLADGAPLAETSIRSSGSDLRIELPACRDSVVLRFP